jgi:hypothetical protein
MMADSECFDPTLLAARQGNKEPQFDEFWFREVLVELSPESFVGETGIPKNGAGISQRGLLPVAVAVGVLELQKVVVVSFGEPVLSSLDRSLDASVLTRDRFRDVHPAQLFDLMIENPIEKGRAPCSGEGVQHGGDVGSDGLAFGSRRAVGPTVLDDLAVCWV